MAGRCKQRTARDVEDAATDGGGHPRHRGLGAVAGLYTKGFGWKPAFRNEEIVFYQMNGFVLGTWLRDALAKDMQRPEPLTTGAFALAHNVNAREAVEPMIERLAAAGGLLLRAPDAPPHGGYRGYVADPDGHAWEIAWNPAWPIDERGWVTFAN